MKEFNHNPGILSRLPCDLHYLIEPARKYGKYQFDNDIDRFLDAISPSEFKELENLAYIIRVRGDYKRVNNWLDCYDITEYEESAQLYYMFGVLDAADIDFE